MNTVLLEKQQELLAQAEQAPLELPAPLPQHNAQEFPTSRKRKTTSFEAAIQEERDALVRRCKEAIQAQEDEDYLHQYKVEAVVHNIERRSQSQQLSNPPPASPPHIVIPPLSGMSIIDISSSSSSSESDRPDDEGTREAQRPRRRVWRTQKLWSTTVRQRKMLQLQRAKAKAKAKDRRGASQGRRHWRRG
jgi:hypothetical protein